MADKTQRRCGRLDDFKVTAATAFQKSELAQSLIEVDMTAW